MKKMMLIFLLVFVSYIAFSGPLRITTEKGTKTVQVEDDYIVEQRRFYIQQDNRRVESWLIVEVAYFYDNKWSDWEVLQETPINYFISNRDLEGMITLIAEYAVEETIDGIDYVFVPSRNNNNQKYWWESRKYLNITRRLYIIKK